jgi:outer membrane protein assembly factor BamB
MTGTATASVTVVNYTVRKNAADGTGRQLNELVLTPAGVSSGKFGQLWSVSLDGSIWGQPLYMNGLTIGGKLRNVVYVATNNDSVYAFDADTGVQLWKKNFLSTGVTAVAGTSLQISSQTGILSTPVIDPVRQVIYVVAETSENNATSFLHRLHALNLLTGAEMTSEPQLITHPNLPPIMKFQRPGLLLANGSVYVAFGSIEDRTPYHGLLFAFDPVTLEQKAVFDVGNQGGIWMSGATPMVDSGGNLYISTGNAPDAGVVGTNNFGESIVKLSPSLQELDHFTPWNYASYDENDLDLGSGSLILVPDQSGQYPHEVIACGKPTPIYVLNRDSLGGLGATSDNILQRLDHQLGQSGAWRDSGQPCYGEPAMWQQNVYFAANHDVMKMFVLNSSTGMLSAAPVSKGTYLYLWPGADPVVSSNGNSNGIVWTVDASTATLHAADATDVSKELYASPSLGSAVRWVPPTVVNGHVYVGASNKIIGFGMTP